MINFIIYEDDKEFIKRYKAITHRFMGKND